jgi:hypothetical protein
MKFNDLATEPSLYQEFVELGGEERKVKRG